MTAHGTKRIATVGVAMFGATVTAGLLITNVLVATPAGDADVRVSRWFEGIRTPRWNELTDLGSAFSDTSTVLVVLAVLVPVLLLATRRWEAPLLVTGAVALETIVFVAAGAVVGRERPPVEQLDTSPPTASFPSGHTGAAVALYIALLVLVRWWTRRRDLRIGATVLLTAVPVVVALSRVYRGMHFVTDVMFGAIVGLVSVAVFASVLRPGGGPDEQAPGEDAPGSDARGADRPPNFARHFQQEHVAREREVR